MSDSLEVKSELYDEDDFFIKSYLKESNSVFFIQFYPKYEVQNLKTENDEDGDLIVTRKKSLTIELECCHSTSLPLVGLQLWRGAFILADFILSNYLYFKDKTILEVASGVGLTSIIASLYGKEVISTDIEEGGILDLIKNNFKKNSDLIKAEVSILPLDFNSNEFSNDLSKKLENVDIILAADVIYDDNLTEAFIKTLIKLLDSPKKRKCYIALEKRYVFTLAELGTVAPCYEHFLNILFKASRRSPMAAWRVEEMKIDFEQSFNYNRTKHIVMWEIST